MRTFEFNYSCDEWFGSIELEISEEDVELIKIAYRNAFECLEDDSDLDNLRERAMKTIAENENFDDIDELDIRIYFPEEITDEADEEDDEE